MGKLWYYDHSPANDKLSRMEVIKANVPVSMKEWIVRRANDEQVSISDIIRNLIRSAINAQTTKR